MRLVKGIPGADDNAAALSILIETYRLAVLHGGADELVGDEGMRAPAALSAVGRRGAAALRAPVYIRAVP